MFKYLLALSLGLSLFPAAALAECMAPLKSGTWSIRQNNGFIVDFNTRTEGNEFRGTATSGKLAGNLSGSFASVRKGALSGGGDAILVNWKVYWRNGSIGSYSGEIDGNGFLRGSTRDEAHPGSTSGINSLTQMVTGNRSC